MRRREIAEESFPICVALSIVLFFVSTALAVTLAHDAKLLRASKGSGGQPLSFQFSAKSARAPSSLKTQAGRLKARPLRGAVEINVKRTGVWSEHLEVEVATDLPLCFACCCRREQKGMEGMLATGERSVKSGSE